MSKPTESKSPNRPLKKSSVGRTITLEAEIIYAGQGTSELLIKTEPGQHRIRVPNFILRAAVGDDL